jgi:hypothetical protein
MELDRAKIRNFKHKLSIRSGISRLLNVSFNKTMTQTQKITPGVKRPKAKSSLMNVSTLNPDPIVLTLKTTHFLVER